MKTLKEYLEAPGGREQFEADIDDIMELFDFEKIARVMDFLNWGWRIGEKDMDTLLARGYKVFPADEDYPDNGLYVPKVKDITIMARKIITDTVESALEAEERGEFKERRYFVDSAGFYCELEIVDDEIRKRAWGDDAPDDFEHSVDIVLRFVLEDNLGKFV